MSVMLLAIFGFIFIPFWVAVGAVIYALLYRGKTPSSISAEEWIEYKQKVDALTLKNAVTRK